MTREEIEKLDGWELAAAVAEHVMGYPKYDGGAHESGTRPYPHFWISNHRGRKQVAIDDGNRDNVIVYWDPSTGVKAVRQMEDDIAAGMERLRHAYTVMLSQVVMGIAGWQDWRDTWAIIRATPEQRCRAALLAVFATPATAAERGTR
jgi:hypothetical protein